MVTLYSDGQTGQAEAYRSSARNEQPERHGRQRGKGSGGLADTRVTAGDSLAVNNS